MGGRSSRQNLDSSQFFAEQQSRLDKLQKLRTPPSGSAGRNSNRGSSRGAAHHAQTTQEDNEDDDDLENVLGARVNRLDTKHRYTLIGPPGHQQWKELNDNASEQAHRSSASSAI